MKHHERPVDWETCGSWTSGELVNKATGERLQPGDMWFDAGRREWEARLAPYYFANNADDRDPLQVMLPNGDHFCVDDRVTHEGGLGDDGWEVTGVAPQITVRPSIHVVGRWHGWLTNGALTAC